MDSVLAFFSGFGVELRGVFELILLRELVYCVNGPLDFQGLVVLRHLGDDAALNHWV